MFDIVQLFIAQADSQRSAEKLRMWDKWHHMVVCVAGRTEHVAVVLTGGSCNLIVVFIYDINAN